MVDTGRVPDRVASRFRLLEGGSLELDRAGPVPGLVRRRSAAFEEIDPAHRRRSVRGGDGELVDRANPVPDGFVVRDHPLGGFGGANGGDQPADVRT